MQNECLGFPRISAVLILMLLAESSWGLPIDWNGTLSLDTTRLNSYTSYTRRREDLSTDAGPESESETSSPEESKKSEGKDAFFQTYVLKLRPTIIINDAASLFGEITTGYASGGHSGQGIEQTGDHTGMEKNRGFRNTLYNYSTYREALNIRQMYAKYYSDTATYIIGRQPLHWGLGAIYNDGGRDGERFASVEDGIMAHLNIGNFEFSPYYMKANGQGLNGQGDMKSIGAQVMYRSSEEEISLGLLLGKRENGPGATFLQRSISDGGHDLGSSKVKIIDIYFQKRLKYFNFELEIPLMDGELGRVFSKEEVKASGYSARAFIGKASYELNPSWKFNIDMGYISGDKGNSSKFEALYLHPNYQIAHLMFRYNLYAINSANEENIFDSYMTNMTYAKFMATYRTNKWFWNIGLIWAKAAETAQKGSSAFHHERNKVYVGEKIKENQNSNYGFEIDLDFKYEWNSNVSILGLFGYHFIGDYYKYDNDLETPNTGLKKPFIVQLQTTINF